MDKLGQITFSHPTRGHDDQPVALALAVYAAQRTPIPHSGEAYFIPHELKLSPKRL